MEVTVKWEAVMDSQNAFWTDRPTFDSELDDLIEDAVQPESGSVSSLKRSGTCCSSSDGAKRLKSDQGSSPVRSHGTNDDHSAHVHPSRLGLLPRRPAALSKDCENKAQNATAVSVTPLRSLEKTIPGPPLPPAGPRVRGSLNHAARREWGPSKDDVSYEELLEHRRSGKLHNVDRYVPSETFVVRAPLVASGTFPLARLQEHILGKIFGKLLVKSGPIQIDFYWLRPFVKGHARVPVAIRSIGDGYSVPVEWDELLVGVDDMKKDMHQFHQALETRAAMTKSSRSPCRGLTTGLLRVSRTLHNVATKVFYGENAFKFPCANSSWLQLESFLVTIGPDNAGKIKHIETHVPLWHRGVHEDFIEGAIVDSFSPASRFGVIKPPAHDRLLSAITHIAQTLIKSKEFKSLTLGLENGAFADYWSGRLINDKQLINMFDAEEFVERKTKGVALLKQLSETLAVKKDEESMPDRLETISTYDASPTLMRPPKASNSAGTTRIFARQDSAVTQRTQPGRRRPMLQLCAPVVSAQPHSNEWSRRLEKVIFEAEKYGWDVDSSLKASRQCKASS